MVGKTYVNENTGPDGIKCNCVYIMEELDTDLELILGITHDEVKQ